MAAPFSNLMSCTLGTSEFQVMDLSWSDVPVLKDGLPRGRQVSVKIEGQILGTSPADLTSKLSAFAAEAARSGRDCIVKGIGGAVLYSLPAAACVDGGPHVTVEQGSMLKSAGLSASFKLSVEGRKAAELEDGEDAGNPAEAESKGNEIRVSTRADLLEDMVIAGEAQGPAAQDSIDAVMADVQSQYAWPSYVVRKQVKRTGGADRLEFEISVEAMATSLPAGGGTRAVEGTYSVSMRVDGDGVRNTTVSYDLVCDGDPMQLERTLRPADKMIVESTVEVAGYKERRLRCSYLCLASDFGGKVMRWSQTWELPGGEPVTAKAVEYEGVGAVLVYNPTTRARRARLSGSAMAIDGFPAPPAAQGPEGYALAEDPRLRYSQLDARRYETSWEYEFVGLRTVAGAELAALIAGLGRPWNPEVSGKPEG